MPTDQPKSRATENARPGGYRVITPAELGQEQPLAPGDTRRGAASRIAELDAVRKTLQDQGQDKVAKQLGREIGDLQGRVFGDGK